MDLIMSNYLLALQVVTPGISSFYDGIVEVINILMFWIMLFDQQKLYVIINNQRNWKEHMSNLIVITVPADGLAPLGGRASVSPVMAKVMFHMYMIGTQRVKRPL